MDKAEPALGREGGRADVPPRAEALLGRTVPEDPAPRGRWERERNPDCGVLLAGHFPLASISAPLLIQLHREQDRTRVVNKSQPRPSRGF